MRTAASFSSWVAGGLAALVLALTWSRLITDERIDGDDLQTLTMAVNLRHHGVASLDREPPYTPSMYREPLPVAVTALSMWLADAALGRASAEAYLAGDRARLLKLQNLVWLALLCASAFSATYLLTSSRWVAALAALLMNVDVIPFAEVGLRPLLVDTLMSEVTAAALFLAAAAFLVAAMRTPRTARFAWAGLCFGLLALTKAAFLYVFVGFAAVLLAGAAFRLRGPDLRAGLARVAALALAFAAVVVPWMARNYVQLGEFQLAERGGVVLYLRALKNEMTADEYRGAIYFWAPKPLQPALKSLLGVSSSDLQRGGRLQRLNRLPEADFYRDDIAAWRAAKPDEAITFIRKALAEQLRLQRLAVANGESAESADAELQRRAVAMIAEAPARHLATTPLFLWRGAFFPLPVLLAALAVAVWRRDYGLGAFVLPALGTIAFFALFTHFLPRYAVPVLPTAVVTVVVLAWYAASSWKSSHAHRFMSKRLVPRRFGYVDDLKT
jgi:hypothetical protein